MGITLKELFENIPHELMVKGDTEISGICYNTKDIAPGDLFVCLKGEHVDGHDFIEQALKARAKGVLVRHKKYIPKGVAGVCVKDTRVTLADISAKFYDYPSQKLNLIGVTGTNGKTTATTLIYTILTRAEIPSGLIGTMCWRVLDTEHKSVHTTPQAVELQDMLSQMAESGVDTTIMEVSSHALSLSRVTGCAYDIVAYTNLTQDHLDFHKNMDNYLLAKLTLFKDKTLHKPDAIALVNADDPFAEDFLTGFSGKKYTYGIENDADFRATDIKLSTSGTRFTLVHAEKKTKIEIKLPGTFNIYNSLLAIAAANLRGVEIEKIAGIIRDIPPIDGRFEAVNVKNSKGKPSVIVDYAHTPDGLEKILQSAESIAPGKVSLVFGCGGDRDRTKRPKMAAIAENYAREIIVTSDNPRSEDPATIIDEVCTGFSADGLKKIEKIVDRKEAIFRAIERAAEGDLVVLAGKGHEDYQIFADCTIHFDDRKMAALALESRK